MSDSKCDVPPDGWWCTRVRGHDGPCAALPRVVVVNLHNDHHLAWARLQDRRQVYIGRGSPWGNPYTHMKLSDTRALWKVRTRAEAIARYEAWLMKQPELLARLPELRGAILVCHCHPLPCHGDVLARLAETCDG